MSDYLKPKYGPTLQIGVNSGIVVSRRTKDDKIVIVRQTYPGKAMIGEIPVPRLREWVKELTALLADIDSGTNNDGNPFQYPVVNE